MLSNNPSPMMKKFILLLIILVAISFVAARDIEAATGLEHLKGKIVLQVRDQGQAWYITPVGERIFLSTPRVAYGIMREFGIGISNRDLQKIPVGELNFTGFDSDGDGLSDQIEMSFGTNPHNVDTDGDGYRDNVEIINGYSPNRKLGEKIIDPKFAAKHKGKIFLQVESLGQAWYVNPADGKRYYLGKQSDAFMVMQRLGWGITNDDLKRIPVYKN
jgi:hypothetical protein